MIDNEIPSIGNGKIMMENPLKRDIGEKTWIKRGRIGYKDKVCYHCHKRGHILYTCNKWKLWRLVMVINSKGSRGKFY